MLLVFRIVEAIKKVETIKAKRQSQFIKNRFVVVVVSIVILSSIIIFARVHFSHLTLLCCCLFVLICVIILPLQIESWFEITQRIRCKRS